MSKKIIYIHAENNNKILSSNEVRLYVPPEPEKMKVLIWGKELCNMAEWNDFLKCVEEKTKEIDQLKQQLAEKQNTIDEINKEFLQAVHDWKVLCAEKDKEISKLQASCQQVKTQLAIQELEKIINIFEPYENDNRDTILKLNNNVSFIDYIEQRIKELGEK